MNSCKRNEKVNLCLFTGGCRDYRWESTTQYCIFIDEAANLSLILHINAHGTETESSVKRGPKVREKTNQESTEEKFSILALERSSELPSINNVSFVNATKSASFISSSVTNSRISSTQQFPELLAPAIVLSSKFSVLAVSDGPTMSTQFQIQNCFQTSLTTIFDDSIFSNISPNDLRCNNDVVLDDRGFNDRLINIGAVMKSPDALLWKLMDCKREGKIITNVQGIVFTIVFCAINKSLNSPMKPIIALSTLFRNDYITQSLSLHSAYSHHIGSSVQLLRQQARF
uniref:Uncharacterized protein n=1 Tax=Glossina austeni TaxID=7395 RepID=A0A1A9UWP2_GLOAU